MALGDFEQAEVCFAEAMERGEQANDARLMLAVCRLEGGAHAEAEALLDQYMAAGGDYADIAYYRANARSMQENYAGAAEDYDAAAEAGQFREESLFAAAQCRYFAGDYAQADRVALNSVWRKRSTLPRVGITLAFLCWLWARTSGRPRRWTKRSPPGKRTDEEDDHADAETLCRVLC